MITSRFFIENKEVIGLWMIYAIIMMLAYCILDTLFAYIKSKLICKKKKVVVLTPKQKEEIHQNCSKQVQAIMCTEL